MTQHAFVCDAIRNLAAATEGLLYRHLGSDQRALILKEVKRLWGVADTFIATKMADMNARVRTVQEHGQPLACLAACDMSQPAGA